MPRYSNIVFLFLLFTASPANAADEQGRYAIHGAGLLKCRVFVEEKSKQSPAYMMIGGWMDGYISAVNNWRSTPTISQPTHRLNCSVCCWTDTAGTIPMICWPRCWRQC